MAHIDVVNLGGETVGSLELADEIFAPEQINEALLWEAVKHYRAAMRQGTAATKNKKLVSGSGKKLWKQKGTGRARVGSVRSPIWRHGGTVHGPQPRSYDYADGKLTVVESLELANPKTKAYRAALDKLDARRTTLLVEGGQEPGRALLLGSRNLDRVELVLTKEVHPYDLLRYERAIFSRAAIEQLQETLKKTVSRRKHAGAEVA
jgi:large subunit ribosomal protein L4